MKPIVQEVRVCQATGQTLPCSEFYVYKRTNYKGDTYYYTEKVCKEYRKQQMRKNRQYKKAMKAFDAIQSERNAIENRAEDVKYRNKTKTFFQRAKDLLSKIF